MSEKPVVVISSTVRDLTDYREQVMDACLRVDTFPKMMDHLPAVDADAVRVSLDLVNEADVYVGVFAHRYGYIPEGHDSSITQMEYERAIERGIPRLIFLMHEEVPVPVADIDFENKPKLDKLKERLKKEQVIAFFKNPDDLRALVLQSLVESRKQMDAASTDETARPTGAVLAASLHYVSDIPTPPEPYIAHPYTLLQVRRLVGRREEMELLTDWVTGKGNLTDLRIFNIVAIGGMGKSALTWTWFNEVAPQEMTPLTGRMWWSFYESDATFENFVTRALAYVSRRPLDEVKQRPFYECENLLLRVLDTEPFLLALDGLERILTAYTRLDAAYIRDDSALDEETAHRVVGALDLPENLERAVAGKNKLRMTADFRAGRFLGRLTQIRASRILISTRLFPADLQALDGNASPGVGAIFLSGLRDEDALSLWREYRAKGSRDEMLPIFRTFENHPLLIQLLAYEVANFHEAPGDFDEWRRANPNFNPFVLRLANVQSHVLAYALSGLSPAELRTLHVIAGFRMPASMGALRALLVRTDPHDDALEKPFGTLSGLDRALSALEDRGLLGWDRQGNRYDLHPIVRGVVWTELDNVQRMALYGSLRNHFEVIPTPDYLEVDSLDVLTPAIELYTTLLRLGRFDEASAVFQDRLDAATHFRLSASRLRVELLEGLLQNERDGSPSLSPSNLSFTLNSLALAYNLSGRPGAAVPLLQHADDLDCQVNDLEARSVGLGNLADALRLSGNLRAAETYARKALVIARQEGLRTPEGASLTHIGLVLSERGKFKDAISAFGRALRIWQREGIWHSESWITAYLADVALRGGKPGTAEALAGHAWKIAGALRNIRDLIHAARVQGTVALSRKQFTQARERLEYALTHARSVSLVEEELPTIVALADWHHQQGEDSQAREILEQVREMAEEGPYPIFLADALNLLAKIELNANRRNAALASATHAYDLAWCDGPPFAYQWGLQAAKHHLTRLGAVAFRRPPFDESQHEPMPEVEINPPDEFGGEEIELSDEFDSREK